MFDLAGSGAIISDCRTWRYRLDRHVGAGDRVFAFFGVNGSTANATDNDQTVRKWIGFSERNNVLRFIVGNAFAYRATDVKELASAADPIGPENDRYLLEIIQEADVLVPCWGVIQKVPAQLRYRFDQLNDMLVASGKPLLCFGRTKDGDPKHPQMLGYATPLIDYDGGRS